MRFVALALLTTVLALPQITALTGLIALEESKPQLKAKHEKMLAVLQAILEAEKADIAALKAKRGNAGNANAPPTSLSGNTQVGNNGNSLRYSPAQSSQ
jgi:hypothetical protein